MADNETLTNAGQDAERWEALSRETPEWFRAARLGYFVHWGPYSVPAWAEPTGELGTVDYLEWHKHNPYAEWYYNTIRIPGSPAAEHHATVYNDCDYDDFLDQWKAENFNAHDVVQELRDGGGAYVVLTTKHHDGVCLWDAPETGTRNTVHRGPQRDLVQEYADACRALGVRFGAYYSGGLDWHIYRDEPIGLKGDWDITVRPNDLAYAAYAARHVRDLIARYQPDVLWNDINWPDAGKDFGPDGIGRVFEEYYEACPEGLVNDRWHVPHADYYTSEYQHMLSLEQANAWENCRGVGLSFGYNSVEGPEHALSGREAVRHLVDVSVRGGRLLLGVGPKADGRLPEWQSDIVAQVGAWMEQAGELLSDIGRASREVELEGAWARTGSDGQRTLLFVDADQPVRVPAGELLTPQWARLEDGMLHPAEGAPGAVVLELTEE